MPPKPRMGRAVWQPVPNMVSKFRSNGCDGKTGTPGRGWGLTCNRGILKGRVRMDAGFIFHRRLCRAVTVWGGNS